MCLIQKHMLLCSCNEQPSKGEAAASAVPPRLQVARRHEAVASSVTIGKGEARKECVNRPAANRSWCNA
jgi:hypothetical protein